MNSCSYFNEFNLYNEDYFKEGYTLSFDIEMKLNGGEAINATRIIETRKPEIYMNELVIPVDTSYVTKNLLTDEFEKNTMTSYFRKTNKEYYYIATTYSFDTITASKPLPLPKTARIGGFGEYPEYKNTKNQTIRTSWKLLKHGFFNAILKGKSTVLDVDQNIILETEEYQYLNYDGTQYAFIGRSIDPINKFIIDTKSIQNWIGNPF